MYKAVFGIDYSLTCPSITMWRSDMGDFCYENTKSFFLTSVKKAAKIDTKTLKGSSYPVVYDTFEERIDYISNWALRQMDFYLMSAKPEQFRIFIEGYSFSSTGQVFQLAENAGLLKHKLHRSSYPFELVPPTVLKKFATGKGNASKFFMDEAFTKYTGVKINEELGLTGDNPSSDIVDSFFLCKMGHDDLVPK